MKITILSGSIREQRQSHHLADYLKDQLTEKGLIVNMIDLKNHPLPLFGSPVSDTVNSTVEKIKSSLKSAHAIIIVTPEYHSNISAALQNTLEYAGLDLIGKVTGIASVSASKFGGLNASGNLLLTLSNLGAYPAPRRLLVPEIQFAFSGDNEPTHTGLKDQVEKFLSELLLYAQCLNDKVSTTQ